MKGLNKLSLLGFALGVDVALLEAGDQLEVVLGDLADPLRLLVPSHQILPLLNLEVDGFVDLGKTFVVLGDLRWGGDLLNLALENSQLLVELCELEELLAVDLLLSLQLLPHFGVYLLVDLGDTL